MTYAFIEFLEHTSDSKKSRASKYSQMSQKYREKSKFELLWFGCFEANAKLWTRRDVSDLIRRETATLTYKSLNSLAPECLKKLFIKCSDDRERVLRSSETDLRILFLKTINGHSKAWSLWMAISSIGKNEQELKILNYT